MRYCMHLNIFNGGERRRLVALIRVIVSYNNLIRVNLKDVMYLEKKWVFSSSAHSKKMRVNNLSSLFPRASLRRLTGI